MNFKNYLFLCQILLGAFYSSAQSWNGTSPIYTESNVGIGFATSPTLSEKLVVNGNLEILYAGKLKLHNFYDGDFNHNYLYLGGRDISGSFSDPVLYGTGIQIIAGSAQGLVGPIGYGGPIMLEAGPGNSSGDGGSIYLDGGQGKVSGNIILQTFKGSTGNVGIGTDKPSAKLEVSGTSFFRGNVGIGILPNSIDRLLVNGNLRINNAGNLSYLSSSDGPGALVVSGENVSGIFSAGDDPALATNVMIKGGDAQSINGVSGYGGNVYLYGGTSNASAEGGNVYLESGQGSKTGNIFMQAYQGNGGSVLIGLKTPISNTKLAVSGNSFFEGNLIVGAANPKPLSILEVGKTSKTYFIDEALLIGIGWNAYKEGTTWKYSNATTPVSRIGQFENGFDISIAKTGTIGATVAWTNVLQAKYSTSNVMETHIGNKESQVFMDGYVSVGGILPAKMPAGYSMAVAKGILTEKVKIATVAGADWKDFVFDDNYKLRSLQEVENFIHTNKHLPEVPSSSEVEQNGYELVKMDATLLQKLEEMTLYVIELQRKMNAMVEVDVKLIQKQEEMSRYLSQLQQKLSDMEKCR